MYFYKSIIILRTLLLAVSIIVAQISIPVPFAYSSGEGGGDADEVRDPGKLRRGNRLRGRNNITNPTPANPPAQVNKSGLSGPDTDAIVTKINSANAECAKVPSAYRADCLAQILRESARIVNKPGYKKANQELEKAAQKLDRLVRQNEDKSAPQIKSGRKTYRAVKPRAVAKVNRKAKKIITETSTKLIRSSSKSNLKKSHYTKIARAVDSTKVLLRSS